MDVLEINILYDEFIDAKNLIAKARLLKQDYRYKIYRHFL